MLWAHTCTNSATKLLSRAGLRPGSSGQARRNTCLPHIHGEPKTRGGEGAGEQEVGRAGRGKGKQHAALCCRACEGNWVGNRPRERFRGRTSCIAEKFRPSLMSRSVRLAQLVPAFVSAHGRRHCTVLDSALYCCPHQHPSCLR